MYSIKADTVGEDLFSAVMVEFQRISPLNHVNVNGSKRIEIKLPNMVGI